MDGKDIISEVKRELAVALTAADFDKLNSKYFTGKDNFKKSYLSNMGALLNEERKERLNTVQVITVLFAERKDEIKSIELKKRYLLDKIDVTLPGTAQEAGGLHPITVITDFLSDIFTSLGFSVYDTGPEIEDDYHNFTALNQPYDHPARDKHDTFYTENGLLLRTHTSPGQIRYMELNKPPVKVIIPGKVFRCDDDATHTPMFHQMEGLVIDKNITLSDLQGMLNEITAKIFSKGTKTRLRPSYFPFTEPSVEIDVSCISCGGKGCSLCKGTGYIEILGGGVVNRRVLKNCGVDPDKYSGVAFGVGIERIAMLKYAVPNIKELYKNDINVIKQFR